MGGEAAICFPIVLGQADPPARTLISKSLQKASLAAIWNEAEGPELAEGDLQSGGV